MNLQCDNVNTIPFLIGEKVLLRPLQEEDASGRYPSWLNDADVSFGNSHHVYPYTRQQAVDFIRSLSGQKSAIVLAIVEKLSMQHVGNISLQSINYTTRCAELAVLLGEKSCWGKGFGTEASHLLVTHGFLSVNLHRIELGTPSFNIGMQKIAVALGMKQEGVKREAFFKNGGYHDIFSYGILRSEYLHSYGGK